MKHDWKLDPDFGYRMKDMMDTAYAKRECQNCGAKQGKYAQHAWMRVTGYRWSPLVGRCKGNNEGV